VAAEVEGSAAVFPDFRTGGQPFRPELRSEHFPRRWQTSGNSANFASNAA